MTLPTYTQAMDAIKAQFLTAWNANAAAVVGYVPEIRWSGFEIPTPPDATKFWVRHSVANVKGAQSTLSNNVGDGGSRRFTNVGFVAVQIFMPKNVANADTLGKQLGTIGVNAYRQNACNGVWFRNSRIVDVPIFENWYRCNVIAEYQFDEAA